MSGPPMPNLELLDPADLSELDWRAAMGLWAENTGLVWRQRLPAITRREPTGVTWRIHYGADGMAERMTWPAWDGRGGW